MKQFVYVVTGISRHFTGDYMKIVVGVRLQREDAMKLGADWAKDQNEQFRSEGRNIHASYQVAPYEIK